MDAADASTGQDAADEHSRLQAEVARLRRQVEALHAETRQARTRLKVLVNSVPDIIYQLDAVGNILFISDAVKRYGYDPERLKGVSFLDLIHPDDRDRAVYRVNERRTGERRTRSLQVRLLTGDHESVSFEVLGSQESRAVTPLEVNAEGLYHAETPSTGTFVGTQGVARDITDRLRAEEAGRQMERERVFTETAGAAAHEINQPLTVVLGTVEMLRARLPAGDPLQADLAEVQESGHRIAEIVQHMRSAHRYVTKPYLKGTRIADFQAASDEAVLPDAPQ